MENSAKKTIFFQAVFTMGEKAAAGPKRRCQSLLQKYAQSQIAFFIRKSYII
jgi:hypothetical protein